MNKILMFGKVGCGGCVVMKPTLQATANDLNLSFEYVDLDTRLGLEKYDSYSGLPSSFPIALVIDATGLPLLEFPDNAYDWSKSEMLSFITGNVNNEEVVNLVDIEGNGQYSTPDDAPKNSGGLVLLIAAVAAINIFSNG